MHFAVSRALCGVGLWCLEGSGLSPACCDLQGSEASPVGLGVAAGGASTEVRDREVPFSSL